MPSITLQATTSSSIPRNGLNFWFNAQNHSNLGNDNISTDRSNNYADFSLLNGSTKVPFTSEFGGSFNFSGNTNNYIKTPINIIPTTNTVTWIIWFKRFSQQVDYAGLFYNRTTGAIAGIHFGGSGNNSKLRYTWNNAHFDVETNLNVSENIWTFCSVAVRSNGATFTMISVTGSKSTYSHTSVTNTALSLTSSFLGWDGFSNRYLNGKISQAFFYTRDLSDSEVQTIYNLTLSRNYPTGFYESGLYKYEFLNEGDCSVGIITGYGIRPTFAELEDGDYVYADDYFTPLTGISTIGDTFVYFSIDPEGGKIVGQGTLCELPE
jgi:hypothetical protein